VDTNEHDETQINKGWSINHLPTTGRSHCRQLGLTLGGCLGQRHVITGLVLGDWGGGRQPLLQLGGQPHLPGQPSINSSTNVREGVGHRQEKADPLRHYWVVELGGGGHSREGASDSSLCATMLERTGGVLWVTRMKWTDWGQVVRNQSEISLI
jgi:hypothetical protein